MPKISIILPIYNVEPYLKECLESIINQKLNDIEIICIDDCSTDNSFNILKEYELKDSKIRIFRQKENLGQGSARNLGILESKGEFITFVDPDDYISTEMYEKMYNQAISLNSDVVMCGVQKFLEQTGEFCFYNPFKIFKNIYESKNVTLLSEKNLEKYEIKQLILISPDFSWNKIYRRDFILQNNIQFSNTRSYQDVIFVMSALLLAENISYIKEDFYTYRVRETSSLRNNKNILKAFEQTLDDIHQTLIQLGYYEELKSHFEYFIIANLKNIFKRGYKIDEQFIDNIEYLSKNEKLYLKRKFKMAFDIESVLKNFAQMIFSVKNSQDKSHKIITILGIKIKFKR